MAQASRHRVNIRLAGETLVVNMHLLELHTFTHIVDELAPLLRLSMHQVAHTRIYLASKVGETEVLVHSRPHYATRRAIDYIAIPAEEVKYNRIQKRGGVWLCLFLWTLLALQAVTVVLVIELVVLKPRALKELKQAQAAELGRLHGAIGGVYGEVMPATGAVPVPLPATTGQGVVPDATGTVTALPGNQQGLVPAVNPAPGLVPAPAPAPVPVSATGNTPTAISSVPPSSNRTLS